MPPKKKPQVNAFFLFAMEWKAKQKRPMSNSEAVNLAGDIWKEMTEQQKGPYKQRAKQEKLQARGGDEKYTSAGIPLSQIEKEEREKDQKLRMMKKDIETIVKRSFSDNSFAEQKYYFIHVNYFAKTVDGNIYVPAEIALSCYCLKDGVINTFHSFINPGTMIFGHAYEAKEHAGKTHQLPLPPKAMGETNFEKIYDEIVKFISSDDGAGNEFPPLFTHDDYIPVVLSILEFMGYDPDSNKIKVYPIEYLFYQLGVRAADLSGGTAPENYYVMSAVFERDVYEYRSGIACDYHETVDASKFCSLSTVVRWGYQFSDAFCNELAISMIPGRHIPADSDLSVIKKFEPKPYFNDTESIISNSTFASTSFQSNITQPKFELPDSSFISTSDDFPALGARRQRKTKVESESGSSVNYASDEDSKEYNPWAIRGKVTPRPPKEESFSFGSIVSGRGRGIGNRSFMSDTSRFFQQE